MLASLIPYYSYHNTKIIAKTLHFGNKNAGCFGELAKGGVLDGGFSPSQLSSNPFLLYHIIFIDSMDLISLGVFPDH
jgi:hypothetical protein